MKIVNRRIQIGIEVDIVDKEGKYYSMTKGYVFFYLISLISFINAGIISIVLIAIPEWFNIDNKWVVAGLIISNLIPLIIFGLIPKRKKYTKIEME